MLTLDDCVKEEVTRVSMIWSLWNFNTTDVPVHVFQKEAVQW